MSFDSPASSRRCALKRVASRPGDFDVVRLCDEDERRVRVCAEAEKGKIKIRHAVAAAIKRFTGLPPQAGSFKSQRNFKTRRAPLAARRLGKLHLFAARGQAARASDASDARSVCYNVREGLTKTHWCDAIESPESSPARTHGVRRGLPRPEGDRVGRARTPRAGHAPLSRAPARPDRRSPRDARTRSEEHTS